jgi:hypothetical protein
LKLLRKVNDRYGFEGAFLDAYSAPRAENLGDDWPSVSKPYGLNVTSYLRTEPIACPIATLRSTFGPVDNSDSDLNPPSAAILRRNGRGTLINLSTACWAREEINNWDVLHYLG